MGLLASLGGFRRSDRARLELAVLALQNIERRISIIMSTQAELAARLEALRAQNEKAAAEQAKALQDLRDAIAAGETTPEVDAALEALAQSIQREDNLNPDAPTP